MYFLFFLSFLLQSISNGILSACNGSLIQVPLRSITFVNSPQIDTIDINQQPNVQIVHNPPEWKYVERVLRGPLIPKPTEKPEYPSGWRPQSVDVTTAPYFIKRSKNHMLPVYLKITYRGTKRTTIIKNIQGDIWLLEKELRRFLENYTGKLIRMRVHEFAGKIFIHNDYVNLVAERLTKKGF